jgi:ribosome-associated translation inhibitor RaiA
MKTPLFWNREKAETIKEANITMNIHIETDGLDSRPTLAEHTKKRLAYAIGYASDNIESIKVKLSDINGPCGGIDKSCHLTIHIRGMEPVVIEDIQLDIFSAIDRAADRAGRSVVRNISRHRQFTRTRPQLINDGETS